MKKTLFNILLLGILLAFVSCNPDNNEPQDKNIAKGLFILNEGTFTYANSSLTFYDPETDTVENNLFYKVNLAPLGDVANSMAIDENGMYIVVNNSKYVYKVDDAVCLGNHEFDNGVNELRRRLSSAKVPVVCANYNFAGSPLEGLIQPYVIVEKAGKKVGVVGLLTDLSDVVSADVSVAIKYQDPKDALNLYAAELKSKGCDLVIALTHLGYEGEAYTDFELASVTRNVDIIVGGHSHTQLDKYGQTVNLDGKKVIIVTDGKWGLNIGKLTVK